ncbi:hypothetical protein [Actinocrispum wychmicini]|uniref:Uncharacterized protein n=1 Tax=Actinocrispum wychmicini TaxID=1213861 RepID=A0A4R2K7R5_9PSEU|nr:hypothetical protein [Actinocrispum wychmicini]TCO65868.1 hypothetical protein EV192_1011660 [Actinocrispum wychmicini]
MSVGGSGIPRLNDLAYLEVAITNAAAGATFEQIRRALVDRASAVDRENDTDGSFDERKWAKTRSDNTKHVHNTVDALKELMRLGWVDKHILPSGPRSAYAHADSSFTVTCAGREWATLVAHDRRAAYNVLVGALLGAHPQFAGFLRVVGALPQSTTSHFTIPLLKLVGTKHSTHDAYLNEFIAFAVDAIAQGALGWSADTEALDEAVRGYVRRISVRLHARQKTMTRKQFVTTCEEAIARFAFTAANCPLDYISLELLRRWTRFLGLANFSYYAPGPPALRLWAISTVESGETGVKITRRVGEQTRNDALDALWQVWCEQRADAAAGMYLPVWQLRAAVCWKQRISDDEFDRAVAEVLAGKHERLGLRIHLDQASLRATPASTKPLILPTASGLQRVFNVISVTPTEETR